MNRRAAHRHLLALAALAGVAGCQTTPQAPPPAAPPAPPPPQPPVLRPPRVGLALGGGAARGFATSA